MLNLQTFYARPRVLLAPMAGYTDKAFRTLCFLQGCELACTEMISAKGLLYGSDRTRRLIDKGPEEGLLAVQLFGKEPAVMEEAAKRICGELGEQIVLLDINCGCPAKKIAGNGEGSALMQDLPLAYKIISAVVKGSTLPVTVKFRKGTDDAHCNAVEFARMAQEAGASALTVHGRTRAQQYSGLSDRSCIRAVVEAVSIPVVGNGDVTDGENALSLLKETGCAGIMVGRGALGNPWIFRDAAALWNGLPQPPEPTVEERVLMLLRHLDMVAADKGEGIAVREIRKHVGWYIKGVRGASYIKREVNTITDIELMRTAIRNILDR